MKKNISIFIFIIISIIMFACKNEKKESKQALVFENTFDNQLFWNNNPLIFKGNAHSGKYLSKVDSLTPFSLGFQANIKELNTKPIKKITAKVWCMFNNLNSNSKLVVAVESDGKNLVWEGTEFKSFVKKPNEWVEITTTAKLPEIKDTNAVVKIYVWNETKETILIDDLNIEIFE